MHQLDYVVDALDVLDVIGVVDGADGAGATGWRNGFDVLHGWGGLNVLRAVVRHRLCHLHFHTQSHSEVCG